jgi:hypothetical protein
MLSIGVLLVILGLGSLLLPMFNLQFRLMELVDPYQPYAGIGVAIIGAVLIYFAVQRRRAAGPASGPPSGPSSGPTEP